MKLHEALIVVLALAASTLACADDPMHPPAPETSAIAYAPLAMHGGPYVIPPPAFDIDAAPDGSILVAQGASILEIRRGEVADVGNVPTIPGSPLNGLAAIGRRSLFATSGGLDLAAGAGVWHVSQGRARLVGDIEAFETDADPDALEGPQWKNVACEEDPTQGFSAGPQSNPYHLAPLTGGTALVADAAGNTLLAVDESGTVDWVAVFTPPVDENGDFRVLGTALSNPEITCYVQPVPTSVAVGPDGAAYVGELTGAPGGPGWSRIWRIEAGARHVTCPSESCTMLVDGLTAVIDLAFGPDGMLYVIEYDANGFLAAVVPAIPLGGGTLSRCDPDTGLCEEVETDLGLPSALTFDKRGGLWLLEDNIGALGGPTVRRVAS